MRGEGVGEFNSDGESALRVEEVCRRQRLRQLWRGRGEGEGDDMQC